MREYIADVGIIAQALGVFFLETSLFVLWFTAPINALIYNPALVVIGTALLVGGKPPQKLKILRNI
ncbi:MAG: hypothetical protein AB1485_00640 [Candidatus Thermoplasmatota archaeon]